MKPEQVRDVIATLPPHLRGMAERQFAACLAQAKTMAAERRCCQAYATAVKAIKESKDV